LAWLLATGAAELRDPAAAVTHARRAVEIAGDDHNYLNTLGAALHRAGQDEEAIAVLQRALDQSPPELAPYDLVFLALAHAALQDWPAANDFFQRTTAAIDSQRQSLTPGRLAELERFLSEARDLGLPH
jgi:tetratricopeptide (TPR) repeat protein